MTGKIISFEFRLIRNFQQPPTFDENLGLLRSPLLAVNSLHLHVGCQAIVYALALHGCVLGSALEALPMTVRRRR